MFGTNVNEHENVKESPFGSLLSEPSIFTILELRANPFTPSVSGLTPDKIYSLTKNRNKTLEIITNVTIKKFTQSKHHLYHELYMDSVLQYDSKHTQVPLYVKYLI